MTVSPYSVEALTAATHDAELRPTDEGSVHVHLDLHHMGVGGVDSWTPLRTVGERYFVSPSQRSVMRLRLSPLSSSSTAAAASEPIAVAIAQPLIAASTG